MFYFLRQNLFEPLNVIEYSLPESEKDISIWLRGLEIQRIANPMVITFGVNGGSEFADFFDVSVPLMSSRLIEKLENLDVKNFQKFDVHFHKTSTGEIFNSHKSVNFLSVNDCVDLKNSEHRLRFGKPYFTGKITIDADKVGSQDVFRLKYGPSFLVITQKLAQELMKCNYKALLIQPTEKYSGV